HGWVRAGARRPSVPPSRLSAMDAIGRSPWIIPAFEDAGWKVRIRSPVRTCQRGVVPSPPPQARAALSAEKASEVAPRTWPGRVRVTEPVWGSRRLIRPAAPALAVGDRAGARAPASPPAA